MRSSEDRGDRKRKRSPSPSDSRGGSSRRRDKDADRSRHRRSPSPARRNRSRSRSPDRRHRDSDSRSHRTESNSRSTSEAKSDVGTNKSSEPVKAVEAAVTAPATATAVATTEEEMRKRRERLKAWQEAKMKKMTEDTNSSATQASSSSVQNDSVNQVNQVPAFETTAELKIATTTDNGVTATAASTAVGNKKKSRWATEDEEDSHAPSSTDNTHPTVTAKPTLHHNKPMKASRWDADSGTDTTASSAPSQLTSFSVSSSSNIAKEEVMKDSKVATKFVEEEADPLDAFMSSLYGSGEVAGQQQLKIDAPSSSSAPKTVTTAFPSSSYSIGNNKVPGVLMKQTSASSKSGVFADYDDDEDNIEDALDLHGSHGASTSHSSAQNKVITLEEIMKEMSEQHARRGWESDAIDSGVNSPSKPPPSSSSNANNDSNAMDGHIPTGETEEEREKREEAERQEFVAAIKKAREEEDKAFQRLQKIDDEQIQSIKRSKELKQKGGELGRVFNEDQDIDLLDEFEDQQKRRSALELLEEAKKGKVLKAVDHSKITYLPFRKNLYVVPRALAKLSAEDVADKRDILQIKVHGNGCPPPVETWEQCGLSDRILDCIYQNNLTEPFAIQRQAIPAIMCGRDVIGVAKTGSGKTLAFLLPMFRHILDQPPLQDGDGPIGLVMAPARELAFQIFNQAKKFCRSLGLRAACIYGGAGVAEQIADLKRGSEIVVCTPGRMIDILCMQAGKLVSLKRVTMVVMDEADRMFDMGFEPQIKMILQNIRPDKQIVLFSATFPKAIEKLAKMMLRLPLEIIVGERSSVNKDITQVVEVHEEDDKFLRLLQLLGIYYEQGSILVFVDKQEKCDQLFQELLKLGYPCLSLHGGKDQVDRDHTLHEFKTGIKKVMIATSVAGRGLDVPDIICVVNYHCPNHLEDYVHRVGRTGRAGRKGVAYTFVSPSKEEQYAPIMVKALQKAAQQTLTNKKDEQAQAQAVPAELLALAESFKAKVARGEAQWSSSGFVGKGFTFDASELNEAQRAALLQKKQYAIEQGISTTGEEGEGDREDREAEMAMYMDDLADANVFLSSNPNNHANNNSASVTEMGSAVTATAAMAAGGAVDPQSALAKARIIAQQLLLHKQTGGSSGSGSGSSSNPLLAAMAGVGGAADGLLFAATAGAAQTAAAAAAAAATTDYFADELEINDYPIQARRKVTNKNAMDEITERTGCAMISRGSFVPVGKKPEPGEKKLYLLIEGRSELQVRQAKMEIQRALEEETMRIAGGVGSSGGGGGGGGGGRYSVV